MLPDFVDEALPPGVHAASWAEVEERFGWNARRRELLIGLRRALQDLAAVGCTRAWLDGSFVTTKELPGDFDLCWDMGGVDYDRLARALSDLDPPRALQQATYGGDVLPNVVEGSSGQPFLEFFQEDAETGRRRGVVELDLREPL